MSYELSPEAEGVLELINLTLDREISFLKSDKWEDKSNIDDKSSRVKMHNTLLSRMLSRCVDLYQLADRDTRNKDVSSIIDKVTKVYLIFKERVEDYLSKEDWLAYIDTKSSGEMKAEIAFQSDLSTIIGGLTTSYKKLPAVGEGSKVRVATLGDKPVPFCYKDNFIEKYPEIREVVESKLKKKK